MARAFSWAIVGLDAKHIEPQFPFGHGLSYTTFGYDSLQVSGEENGNVVVRFRIKNTGQREGSEVAQVYVADRHASVPRPPKELKGFAKLALKPDESRLATVTLDRDAFSFWHPQKKVWVVEPGEFAILVGASSRDIRLTGTCTIK